MKRRLKRLKRLKRSPNPRFAGPRGRCVAAFLRGDMEAYGAALAELRALLPSPGPRFNAGQYHWRRVKAK